MKGKVILCGVGLSFCLAAGYQTPIKQVVSTEIKDSSASQKNLTSSTGSDNTTSKVVEESVESMVTGESSIEEIPTSETTELIDSPISINEATAESDTYLLDVTESSIEKPAILPEEEIEENYQFSFTRSQTTESFIQAISKDAQQIAWKEDLYASVMIAQAILETGSGNSQLARPPHHNLFGIKGSYQGKNVTFNTQEDQGNGQLYTTKAAFRQYPSYKESLEDYAALLRKGIPGNAEFYQATWKENAATFQEASKALTGKYATDTSYDKKLNALIETYQLMQFDQEQNQEVTEASSEIRELPQVEEVHGPIQEETRTLQINEKKQKVSTIPAAAQRPAKQLPGYRAAK
ncbi:glucosaminidase domain-containing protein [Enterococcus sp. AZ163]|uniref:glucosaminidase domain-containing protein n=1 Tax=Enterococcus sp. AZ163 TaxID=2774638 RepID=UPI003D2C5D06